MNRRGQVNCGAAAIVVMAACFSFSLPAQTNSHFLPRKNFSSPTNLIPPVPQWRSPVDFFRQLLVMSPAERKNYLTNKPPEIRARILGKVNEYLALDPDERELRLDATDLRWYLLPLLHESPKDRAERLKLVPDNLRGLIQSRLAQWDALPPKFQKEFLDNEHILHYFTHVDATNSAIINFQRAPDENEAARWNGLSDSERQKITNQFNEFFELTPDEKQKTLNTLSDAERAQMEKTLQAFDKLPGSQRIQCIRAFTEFASMSLKDRAEFLKNAERWSQLSPKERQAWRDLVARVPQWPPLPIMPPIPPHIHPHLPQRQMVATNLN